MNLTSILYSHKGKIMNMKTKLYIFLFLLFTSVISGCYDKKELRNDEVEVIAVEGLKDTIVYIGQTLEFTPTVTSNMPNADFSYKWEIYSKSAIKQEISTEKDLSLIINRDAGVWTLVFHAKNNKTGFSFLSTSVLRIDTEYTRGWYVLKDDGTNSDIDQFLTPNSILETEKTPKSENIISTINGRSLDGKSGRLGVCPKYTIMMGGKVARDKFVLSAFSEKDAMILDVTTMKKGRDINDMTYNPFTVKNVQALSLGSLGTRVLINDGQLHTMNAEKSSTATNAGIFSAPRVRLGLNNLPVDYKMSKYAIVGTDFFLAFDQISTSFYQGNAKSPYMDDAPKSPLSNLALKETGLECIYLGVTKEIYMDTRKYARSYGVFKDKTGQKGIYLLNSTNNGWEFSKILNLTSSDKAYNAEIFTIPTEEDVMYFESAGVVYSYNLSNTDNITLTEEFNIPDGEKLSVLRHMKNGESANAYKFDYMVVGTNVGGNYKFRMFTRNEGNFSPKTPVIEFGGKGNCSDVIYVAPNMVVEPIPLF